MSVENQKMPNQQTENQKMPTQKIENQKIPTQENEPRASTSPPHGQCVRQSSSVTSQVQLSSVASEVHLERGYRPFIRGRNLGHGEHP